MKIELTGKQMLVTIIWLVLTISAMLLAIITQDNVLNAIMVFGMVVWLLAAPVLLFLLFFLFVTPEKKKEAEA